MSAAEQLGLPLEEEHRRSDNRSRVAHLLRDHAWHTAEELLRVGGIRFGARVHELRHGARTFLADKLPSAPEPTPRILSWVRAGESLYRWTCDCGLIGTQLGEEPADGPDTHYCPICRAALAEMDGKGGA